MEWGISVLFELHACFIDAIHDGTLDSLGDSDWETTEIFNLRIPKEDL
jgi:hypothetical protein